MNNILYTDTDIEARVKELGALITENYCDSSRPLLVIGVLNGSFMFLSDLVKCLNLACKIEFVKISSYIDNKQTDNLKILYHNLDNYNLKDYNILIVEDIIDTGCTMNQFVDYLINTFNLCETDIKICTLLYKEFKNKTSLKPDYVGFYLKKDYFVVGYGMDNCDLDRNLSYIYTLN